MEQKTEASQAVDDLVRACKAATSDAEKVAAIDAYRAALKAQPAPTEATATLLPIADRHTESKTNHIIERDGYKKVGYVLENAAGDYCLSAQSAVRWLSQSNYWRLMHEQDGKLFGTHAPTEAAQGAQLSRNSGELAQGEDSVRLDWKRVTAPEEGGVYSDEGCRRAHTDGRVQAWDDEDMDEWHGGFWRDAD